MNIIIIILFFLLGVLVYTILKSNCECLEGYSSDGEVNLENCCPNGYMFSTVENKCINLCLGCSLETYGDMNLENIAEKKGEFDLEAYYECKEHDAKNIYGYDKLNGRFSRSELLDQNNYGFDLVDETVNGSGSGSGVQASEEGGAWSDINTEISNFTRTDFEGEIATSIYGRSGFRGISTSLYYTSRDECIGQDYNTATGQNVTNCFGHWKLDLSDERYTYLNDNPETFFTAPFIITQTPPEGTTSASYIASNIDMLNNILRGDGCPITDPPVIDPSVTSTSRSPDCMDPESPIFKYYNDFLTQYNNEATSDDAQHNETLTLNRTNFCIGLTQETAIQALEQGSPAVIMDELSVTSLCLDGSPNHYEWNTRCSSGQVPDPTLCI